MKARSVRWDAAVVQPHQLAIEVNVLYNQVQIAGPLNVVSGTVTLDRTASQYGRFDGRLAEPTRIATSINILSPYGYELAVSRGIRYVDGVVELMPLGVFPIQVSNIDGVTLSTDITARDRSQLVKDARLEDDYQIVAGVNYATAIHDFIDAGVPGLVYSFEAVSYNTPLLTFAAQSDRWDQAQEMAKSCGCELFFNGIGTLVLRHEPTFTALPVWTIAEGAGGVMIGASLLLDRGPSYNRVIATGTNASLGYIPRGVWTDTLAASPSNYIGGFGRKPRFYASEFITNDTQALDAATSIGLAQQGVARSLDLQAVPNPALEPGDIVTVRRSAMGVNEAHLLDSVTIGLAVDQSMTAAARAQIGESDITAGAAQNINAGVATGTGTANDVARASSANAGVATGAGVANNPTVTHVP